MTERARPSKLTPAAASTKPRRPRGRPKRADAPVVPWDEVEAWRLELHRQFDEAAESTKLPERPDYERANAFLVKARRRALGM